jgi:uncharacterized membrane protein
MKYKPLLICMGVIAFLWLLRCLMDGTITYYGFVFWNSFLATVPLLLEPLFGFAKRHLNGVFEKLCRIIIAAAWLLFLPNAFYILTDFMHLNPDVLVNERGGGSSYVLHYVRGDAVYMVDVLLLFVASAYGAYVGGLALLHAYAYFKRSIPRWSKIVLGFILLLSAIGVYIGRFGRWNSWDGLLRPWEVAGDLWGSLSEELVRNRFLSVVFAMIAFQCLSMWLVWYAQQRTQSCDKNNK